MNWQSQDTPQCADSELRDGLELRDPKALTAVFDRYGRIVYSIIIRMVGDSAVAEDLTQEVFLRAWSRSAQFDKLRGSVRPWLVAIARHRAIDHLRAAAGRPASPDSKMERFVNPTLFADLEAGILNLDRERLLKETLANLSENHRQVIQLAYFEGLSHTEIAIRTCEPLGTIKTRVRSALTAMRMDLTGAEAARAAESAKVLLAMGGN